MSDSTTTPPASGQADTTRQMANQAFFTRIYLDTDDQITTEPTASYRLLLDPAVQKQALTWMRGSSTDRQDGT